MAKRFLINGIEVIAEPQGNGMWAAVPVDLPGTILKVLTGKININDFLNPSNLNIVPLESLEDEQEPEVDTAPEPVRSKSSKTVREYRKAEGMNKTEMADYLGVSRRTLGRWEDAGKLASEVGL
jgi:DNA-binding transcriptional regulator YiaG